MACESLFVRAADIIARHVILFYCCLLQGCLSDTVSDSQDSHTLQNEWIRMWLLMPAIYQRQRLIWHACRGCIYHIHLQCRKMIRCGCVIQREELAMAPGHSSSVCSSLTDQACMHAGRPACMQATASKNSNEAESFSTTILCRSAQRHSGSSAPEHLSSGSSFSQNSSVNAMKNVLKHRSPAGMIFNFNNPCQE